MTGASIAGAAAAWWLDEVGYDVTVQELAPGMRESGQNVDVRATGREVLRRMDLENAVRRRNTGEVGTRFVDEQGGTVSEFPVDDSEGHDGPTAELEILRGALAGVLADACPSSLTWRFGDRVVAVDQEPGSVTVRLESGAEGSYELLVVAEGVGSATRALVWGDAVEERPLGMYAAYATIPRTDTDDDWWRALIVTGSRQASLRPDDEGTTRANLNFLADGPELDGLDDAGVRRALRQRFEGVGWEVPRILDGFDAADDLYVDWLRQVRAPTWHEGRVVLLGDAAWCVTPIGGLGTSLALTGAYVLAASLSQSPDDVDAALGDYESWMRPLVEEVQDLPPGVPRIAAPRTTLGVGALRLATRVAGLPPVQAVARRVSGGPGTGSATDADLPPVAPPERTEPDAP